MYRTPNIGEFIQSKMGRTQYDEKIRGHKTPWWSSNAKSLIRWRLTLKNIRKKRRMENNRKYGNTWRRKIIGEAKDYNDVWIGDILRQEKICKSIVDVNCSRHYPTNYPTHMMAYGIRATFWTYCKWDNQ